MEPDSTAGQFFRSTALRPVGAARRKYWLWISQPRHKNEQGARLPCRLCGVCKVALQAGCMPWGVLGKSWARGCPLAAEADRARWRDRWSALGSPSLVMEAPSIHANCSLYKTWRGRLGSPCSRARRTLQPWAPCAASTTSSATEAARMGPRALMSAGGGARGEDGDWRPARI